MRLRDIKDLDIKKFINFAYTRCLHEQNAEDLFYNSYLALLEQDRMFNDRHHVEAVLNMRIKTKAYRNYYHRYIKDVEIPEETYEPCADIDHLIDFNKMLKELSNNRLWKASESRVTAIVNSFEGNRLTNNDKAVLTEARNYLQRNFYEA